MSLVAIMRMFEGDEDEAGMRIYIYWGWKREVCSMVRVQ